jgi:signal peptidase II
LSRFAERAAWLWLPAVLLLDFLTKRLVLANSLRLDPPVEVLGTVFRLTDVRNPGAAMGLAFGGRPFLVTVSVVAVVVLTILYLRTPARRYVRRGAVAAILGGALGNLVDRIFYNGFVVDFIDLGFGAHRFYTFNVADMGVSLGGAVLFLSLWRADRDEVSGGESVPDPVPSAPAPEDPDHAV